MRALTILSLYGNQPESDSPFSDAEMAQMQSQFALNEKTLGGLVDKIHFPKFKEREAASLKDTRGHNWELLRQQAEASGLYFEPLKLSDEAVTHALLWFPVDAVSNKDPNHPYLGRFLNIKNPWRDQRLSRWKGYTEKKYFNLDNQLVSASDPSDADHRAVTMIPLAVYGLDFQKIPALLIDFRDSANPRRRELSGRLLNDITRDVLSISRFGNVYYFVARSAFDFVTSRRGIDINQPSRLRSAAELRLLLSFNADISDDLRAELNKGLENLSVNPLENGSKAERDLAFAQYRALRDYAVRADGLPARLEQERGAELAKLKHRGWDGKFLRVANILTLGHYTHREKVTPELRQQLNKERELAYHTTFLRQVARSTPIVEVSWNLEEVRESLRYISENGSIKDKESAKAVASIFSRTKDGQARDLCLSALMRIGNKVATREMLRIYSDASVPAQWRTATAEYLKIDPPQQSKTVDVLAEPQQNGSQP
jgi:HEAT repeat protein